MALQKEFSGATIKPRIGTPGREYYSFAEMAKMIGRHRTTIHRWVKRKVLPPPVYLTPHTPMFVAAEIHAWRDQHNASRTCARKVPNLEAPTPQPAAVCVAPPLTIPRARPLDFNSKKT